MSEVSCGGGLLSSALVPMTLWVGVGLEALLNATSAVTVERLKQNKKLYSKRSVMKIKLLFLILRI